MIGACSFAGDVAAPRAVQHDRTAGSPAPARYLRRHTRSRHAGQDCADRAHGTELWAADSDTIGNAGAEVPGEEGKVPTNERHGVVDVVVPPKLCGHEQTGRDNSDDEGQPTGGNKLDAG